MKIIGVVLASFYAIVATASSLATGDTATSAPVGGTLTKLDCLKGPTANSSVSRPDTTVTVTCSEKFAKVPTDTEGIFVDSGCTEAGKLSSVCPGATVTPVKEAKNAEEIKTVNVFFPQLPTSAQVVCLKCPNTGEECKAVIDVTAAPPQGPQACAVAGSSVTLQINEAGGSAQFACGEGFDLAPKDATKAYAGDCTKEETLQNMKRSSTPGKYFTLKVDKLKKKKMCYLCKPSSNALKTGAGQDLCTIYVEVSGSTRLRSSFRFGVALLCVAAMLRFI